jgi:hypothetical protein
MSKVRFVAMCTIGVALATFSIASAQTYTTIDFPGAVTTTLNGGPNPQGTSVGSYTDTSNVTHGFTLTKKDVFTSFDPPGSTSTTPNFINTLRSNRWQLPRREYCQPRFHSGWRKIHNG